MHSSRSGPCRSCSECWARLPELSAPWCCGSAPAEPIIRSSSTYVLITPVPSTSAGRSPHHAPARHVSALRLRFSLLGVHFLPEFRRRLVIDLLQRLDRAQDRRVTLRLEVTPEVLE